MILTQEQEMIRDTLRQFAQERLAPNAADWERNHTFPREALAELGELGAVSYTHLDVYKRQVFSLAFA